jgi:hypothetical protein
LGDYWADIKRIDDSSSLQRAGAAYAVKVDGPLIESLDDRSVVIIRSVETLKLNRIGGVGWGRPRNMDWIIVETTGDRP